MPAHGETCWIRETQEGRWFYGVETGMGLFVGDGGFEVWGPFLCLAEAEEHLHGSYPNPDEATISPWLGEDSPDPEGAKKPSAVRRWWW